MTQAFDYFSLSSFLARLSIPIAKGGLGEEISKDRMQNYKNCIGDFLLH